MDPIDKINYKGYDIEIFLDYDSQSPREWDNLGTIICFHKRYILGDNTDIGQENYHSWEDLETFLYKKYNALIVIPIYMYDHSGITIRTYPFPCRWDSGQIGYIYVSKKKVREEYGIQRISKKLKRTVKTMLLSEIEVYDHYVSGDVYGYSIEDKVTEENINSCFGFYGNGWKENGLLDYAENAIDWHIKEIEQNIAEDRILEIG